LYCVFCPLLYAVIMIVRARCMKTRAFKWATDGCEGVGVMRDKVLKLEEVDS
jgi:hypothetical protein